jgi:ATP-dependent helicase/nuclease subunit A
MSLDPTALPLDPTVLQRQASDPAASVWVGASAGTGKTKVLTDRVLRLMLAGTDPGRILCLTFTKAAAAEMANRVAARLAGWTTLPDAALEDALAELTGERPHQAERQTARRLFARLLETPGGMKIQTIHAFCQSLLRRFPLEAGLSPHFELMDDRTAEEQLQAARTRVLIDARTHPDSPLGRSMALLTGTLSEDQFSERLTEITRERGRIRRILAAEGGLEGCAGAIAAAVGIPGGTRADALLAAACQSAEEADLRSACAALAGGTKTDLERSQTVQRWLDLSSADRPAGWPAYVRAFLTAEGEVRKTLLTKAPAARFPAALAALEAEAIRILAVESTMRSAIVAEASLALLTMADAMLQAFQDQKAARGLLDYDDLILTAADLLRGDTCAWVLFKLDGGLDHVLIDEAQDTNPDQWRIVAAIAEEFFHGLGRPTATPRTLFVVGDEKQSIFSFQRADPAEFRRMREHFSARVTAAGQRWRDVDLQISFRSVGAVLKAVNSIFSSPQALNGVAAAPLQHLPFRRGMAGQVELWPPVSPTRPEPGEPWALPVDPRRLEPPMARLARTIAGRIQTWLAGDERLPARQRGIRPGDILILVRRRNAFVTHMVRALKECDVPVAGVDRMLLSTQLAVMDLLALAGFLLLPDDDLTLATLLKSPLLGFSEDQLFDLAQGRTGSLWSALQSQGGPAHDWLRSLLAETDFQAPFELFAGVLVRPCPGDPGSGRRAILGRLGPEAQDPLDEFLSAALDFEQEHVPSLQGFVHWLSASDTEIKRELEATADGPGGGPGGGPRGGRVRIMTVHGSKGLQAPVVILPDMVGTPDQSPRILWPDGNDDRTVPLFAPRAEQEDAACRSARQRAAERRDQEYRRLLYVALTRAEDRLVLCGWEGKNAPSDRSWYSLARTALAEIADTRPIDLTEVSPSGWSGDGLLLRDEQIVPIRDPGLSDTGTSPPAPPPDWLRQPPPVEAEPTRPLTPSRPEGVEPAVRSPLGPDDGTRFKRGSLIHKLLQTLPDLPSERREAAARHFLGSASHGLSGDQADAIASETIRVLNDPAFAQLFGPDSRAEVPLVGVVGGRTLSGQIDRLAVTGDTVWIVDYKTNRPPPRRLADVPAIYIAQMAAYRAALSALYPARTVRCVLLWTDGPFTTEIPADLLDLAAPDRKPLQVA